MTPGLLASSRNKHKLFSIKLKHPSDQNIENFKKYNYIMNKCMRSAKKKYYMDSFESSKKDLKETWRLIGEVAGRTKKSDILSKTFEINGHLTNNPKLIAEGFNQFLERLALNLLPESKLIQILAINTILVLHLMANFPFVI